MFLFFFPALEHFVILRKKGLFRRPHDDTLIVDTVNIGKTWLVGWLCWALGLSTARVITVRPTAFKIQPLDEKS